MNAARFKNINRVSAMAHEVDLAMSPAVDWETDIIWLRKKSIRAEALITGTLDQVEEYINHYLKLKAFL